MLTNYETQKLEYLLDQILLVVKELRKDPDLAKNEKSRLETRTQALGELAQHSVVRFHRLEDSRPHWYVALKQYANCWRVTNAKQSQYSNEELAEFIGDRPCSLPSAWTTITHE